MKRKVFIDQHAIEARNFKKESSNPYKISFVFTVTHEEYHDVATLLYKNDFVVKVPEENLEFSATITNYSTSITNLYEEGAKGEYSLELTEKSI